MNRITHFEIAAEKPDRAVEFYSNIFGWKISKWDGPTPYWLVSTGEGSPGINGGIIEKTEQLPSVINTIDVENLDSTIEKIVAAGGSIHFPKMVIPSVGYMAYCKDTEGNVFGVMQEDPNAKE
ncbi:MAG: VOC family protein [Bacteroidota bacterium]|nr:VOC family protein [Bacteroidota bacterium]